MLVKEQSTRLPGKNTMDFGGKPMFFWNLDKCLSIFRETYVSTDSDWIMEMAAARGAIPIKRTQELCGDTPDIPVYQHALAHMKHVSGIVAVHANNPLIESVLIKTVKRLVDMGIPEVMTCYPMVHMEEYKKQHNLINGSIRGMTTERLHSYGDPYRPNPDVLLVDSSIEIEVQDDYDRALCQLKSVS